MSYCSSPQITEIISKVKSKLAGLLQTHCPLYRVQEKALKKLLEETATRNRLVFQLPTGTGKTRVVAAYLWGLYYSGKIKAGDKIVFITPRILIRKQVKEEFGSLLKEPFHVECFEGEGLTKRLHCKLLSQEQYISVMVITLQLLSENYREYGKMDFENMKGILLDEGHYAYWGPENSKIFSNLLEDENRIILAFTATPTSDLVDSLGYPVYHYHSLRAMEHEILVSRLKVHAYNTIVDLDTDSFNRVSINDRAQKFAEETVRILEEETKDLDYNLRERIPKTLIVATNVREADKIYQKLKELIPEKSSVIKLAHYKTEYSPSEEVEEFKGLSEGILVTVNMADMGFDDRNLEMLVIARRIKTPVAYVQIRGRVLRRHVTYDPNSIKKRREYALLVDFTGSVLEHEKQEIVEQVEEGRFSSEGVYADLVGGFREGEVREIEANVEINKLQAFMVPEGESESIVSPEEARKEAKLRKRSLKTILREFNELFDSERRLRRCEELVDNLEEDIEDIERRIRKRSEISKNLQDMLMNILLSNFEKQVSSSIEEQEIRKALIENECTIAVLEGILGIQKGIKEVLERMYEQIKSEMSKEHENSFHVRN